MRIAYLINQYPKVSHAFIRREILALEQLGFEVKRISLRGWDLELADQHDLQERERTRYALGEGPWLLVKALARAILTQPARFLGAFALALRMGWHSERPVVHIAYLAEACLIEAWLSQEKIQHLHAHFGT